MIIIIISDFTLPFPNLDVSFFERIEALEVSSMQHFIKEFSKKTLKRSLSHLQLKNCLLVFFLHQNNMISIVGVLVVKQAKNTFFYCTNNHVWRFFFLDSVIYF